MEGSTFKRKITPLFSVGRGAAAKFNLLSKELPPRTNGNFSINSLIDGNQNLNYNIRTLRYFTERDQ